MEYRFRDLRLIEKDREKTIKYENDIFVIKALFPKDYREISRRIALEQTGLPINAFSVDDRYKFQRDITVDYALVSYPDWWNGSANCPFEEILDFLYKEIQDWTNEFQESLKKNRLNKRSVQPPISS
jgi:hypothetical protein